MTEDDALRRFGLNPSADAAPEIRSLLLAELKKEESESGDQELIKLLCIQLFAIGKLDDSLLVWEAKQAGFDLSISIDIQLVCGGGLKATKEFLRKRTSKEARQAAEYISQCEEGGDFERFSLNSVLDYYRLYYHMA